jgi:hypothetical protein
VASPPIIVQFPDELYAGLRTRAEESQRTLQEELVHVVSLVVPGEPQLPEAIRRELNQLSSFSDDLLWEAAQTRVAADVEEQLDELSYQRRFRELTDEEKNAQAKLLMECDRVMLVRAHAALLLKQRGHDISPLFREP